MIVRLFYVKRSDLGKWIAKDYLMRGRNYARHCSSVVNISSTNQKEIAGNKSTNITAEVDILENDVPTINVAADPSLNSNQIKF